MAHIRSLQNTSDMHATPPQIDTLVRCSTLGLAVASTSDPYPGWLALALWIATALAWVGLPVARSRKAGVLQWPWQRDPFKSRRSYVEEPKIVGLMLALFPITICIGLLITWFGSSTIPFTWTVGISVAFAPIVIVYLTRMRLGIESETHKL